MAADDPRDGHVPGPPYLTTEELRRDVSALREILQARLDGMDRATVVLSETVNRTPTAIQIAVSHLQELHDERFKSIAVQFAERDVRTEQAAKASKEALDAALLAAKELVSQQNEANAAAADKAEQSTIKQIDQIGIRIDTMQKALDDRLTELKERIDRGEGSSSGSAVARSDQRLNVGQVIAAVAVLVAIVSFILYAVKKLREVQAGELAERLASCGIISEGRVDLRDVPPEVALVPVNADPGKPLRLCRVIPVHALIYR